MTQDMQNSLLKLTPVGFELKHLLLLSLPVFSEEDAPFHSAYEDLGLVYLTINNTKPQIIITFTSTTTDQVLRLCLLKVAKL
jgi:hypothetical protein